MRKNKNYKKEHWNRISENKFSLLINYSIIHLKIVVLDRIHDHITYSFIDIERVMCILKSMVCLRSILHPPLSGYSHMSRISSLE